MQVGGLFTGTASLAASRIAHPVDFLLPKFGEQNLRSKKLAASTAILHCEKEQAAKPALLLNSTFMVTSFFLTGNKKPAKRFAGFRV